MKIIQSFFLVAVGFCTTTIVYAQELKPEIAKPVEIKTPEARPELKPQPQAVASTTDAPAKATAAPSPSTGKENAKPEEKEKLEAKTFDKNDIATPGGEEGRKIMAGNTTRTPAEINNQSTIDLKPAPQVKPSKPVNGRQQQ